MEFIFQYHQGFPMDLDSHWFLQLLFFSFHVVCTNLTHFWFGSKVADVVHLSMTASLVLKWFVPHKHIQYKHPWWWLLKFDPCPGILDDVKCDSINVQASLMMIVAIWSVCKYPWWWLWGFDPCPSILDDYYCDFIHVQASLMMITAI